MALAYWLRPDYAITVNYGQVAAPSEIRAASAFCDWMKIAHEVVNVNCRELGCGEMAGVPEHALSPKKEWWPYRNQFLVTVAAMKLIHLNVHEICLGTVKGDDVFADGREDFVHALDRLLRMQEGSIRISAPAMHLTSPELVLESKIPIGLLALAHSCHQGVVPCGECRGRIKNQEVFAFLEELTSTAEKGRCSL